MRWSVCHEPLTAQPVDFQCTELERKARGGTEQCEISDEHRTIAALEGVMKAQSALLLFGEKVRAIREARWGHESCY